MRAYYNELTLSLRDFLDNKLENFDAQVSDNLCQVRACQLIDLALKIKNDDLSAIRITLVSSMRMQHECDKMLLRYNELLNIRKSSYDPEYNKNISLDDFLVNSKLCLKVSFIEYYLFQTYILSKYKVILNFGISTGVRVERICFAWSIRSKRLISKVIKKFQRNISFVSCSYVLSMISKNDVCCNSLLGELYKMDEVGRHVIACYEVTKLLLEYCIENQRFVSFTIHRLTPNQNDIIRLIFKGSRKYKRFVFISEGLSKSCEDGAVCFQGLTKYVDGVFESKNNYISRLLNVGVIAVILANMAQHPQYAGLKLNDLKNNPYEKILSNINDDKIKEYFFTRQKEFNDNKLLAEKLGCSINNSSLFLLTHVFSESFDESVDKVSNSLSCYTC